MEKPIKKIKFTFPVGELSWDEKFSIGLKQVENFYAQHPTLTLLKKQGRVKPTLYVFAPAGIPVEEALQRIHFEITPFDAEEDRSYGILWNPRTNEFGRGPWTRDNINMAAIETAILECRLSKADFKDLIWSDPAQALWEFISKPGEYSSKSLLRDNKGLYKIAASGGRVLFRTQKQARQWVEERCFDFEEEAFSVCQSWKP